MIADLLRKGLAWARDFFWVADSSTGESPTAQKETSASASDKPKAQRTSAPASGPKLTGQRRRAAAKTSTNKRGTGTAKRATSLSGGTAAGGPGMAGMDMGGGGGGGSAMTAPAGVAQIPLGQVATIRRTSGPMMIKTEGAFPTAWVYLDVEGRDIGSYVADARAMVDEMVTLPAGYSLEWSGQYEYMERAKQKLQYVIPATLLIILLLLYMNFRSVGETMIVMLSLPFALVGGVFFMWALGYNWSVATVIGFIALAGVAAETGVVMLIYLDLAWRERLQAVGRPTLGDLYQAVMHGAVERVRPKMMTVTTVIGGLLPILWGTGTGASVMKRIAAPMVGGMISSTILTLIVIPAIYSLWREWQLRRQGAEAAAPAVDRVEVAEPVPAG